MSEFASKISIIGLGVVGLATAVGFAQKGRQVVGIDINADKVKAINQGESPIHEPELAEALRRSPVVATTDFEATLDTDISILCGGTPGRPDGSLDLAYVKRPAEQLARVLAANNKSSEHLVVMRSTVLPGTTEGLIAPLFRDMDGIGICANPEFLREGTALDDFLTPSRIVIGANQRGWAEAMLQLYADFPSTIITTDIKTAEMVKYASNTFLATRISLINEIGNLCKLFDIDVYDVANGIGYDSRIGHDYLRAGVGFGGFCLPKDLAALKSQAQSLGYEARILEEVERLNKEQPLRMVKLLKQHLPEVRGRTIGILGLAFKAGTDDVRGSVANSIIDALAAEDAKIRVHDPVAMRNFEAQSPRGDIEYATAAEVLAADATLIVTDWPEFELLDYRDSLVIDGRRVDKAREARVYEGICW